MQNQRSGFVAGLLAGAALATAAFVASPLAAVGGYVPNGTGMSGSSRNSAEAVQAGSTGAKDVKIVLDNARVRVRDVTFQPGSSGMHTHELAHVGVVIQGGTLVFKYPDGKQETAKLESGGVGFRDANVTHEPVNTGTTPVRVIEVELK